MDEQPKPNADHRDTGGKFAKGNKCGKGNPFARKVARLRSALLKTIKPEDIREVVAGLLAQAKAGDVAAAKELLSRALGPAEAVDLLARVEQIEATLSEAQRGQAKQD